MPPMLTQPLARLLVGQPDRLVRGREDLGRRTELATQAVGEHLELQLADGGEDRLAVAEVGVAQHLHHALLVELREALAELLEPPVVERSGLGEHLRGEPRDRRELHGRPA